MSIRFIKQLVLLFIPIVLGLTSCDPEDNKPKGKYSSGVFVINEGNFMEGDGSIGFYDKESKTYTQDIFQVENQRVTGGTVQSYSIFDGTGYIVINNSDKVEIVDAETFKSKSVISEGLSIPRFVAVSGTKAYISNWGPYANDFTSPDSYIAVVDLSTGAITKTVEVESRPEQMLFVNNKLYIANNAAGLVSILNTSTDVVEGTIEVIGNPKTLTLGNNNTIWVGTDKGFAKINTDNKTAEAFDLNGLVLTGHLALNKDKNRVYIMTTEWAQDFSFTTNRIIAFDQSANHVSSWPEISKKNLYGFAVDPETDILYAADNNAFQGNGTVIRFDKSGIEMDNFAAGRAPNGFVFR